MRLLRGLGRHAVQPADYGTDSSSRRHYTAPTLRLSYPLPTAVFKQWRQHRPAQDVGTMGRRCWHGRHASAAGVDSDAAVVGGLAGDDLGNRWQLVHPAVVDDRPA